MGQSSSEEAKPETVEGELKQWVKTEMKKELMKFKEGDAEAREDHVERRKKSDLAERQEIGGEGGSETADEMKELKDWVEKELKEKEKQRMKREEEIKMKEETFQAREKKMRLWEDEILRREGGLKRKFHQMQYIPTQQLIDEMHDIKRRVGDLEASEKRRRHK